MTVDWTTLSDHQLASRSQEGSLKAFEELVARHEQSIYRFIASKTKRTEDAKDLTQEVFIRAWQRIDRFSPQYPFAAWLFTLARNNTVSYFRKSASQLQHLDHYSGQQEDPTETPVQTLERSDQHENFWQTVKDQVTEDQLDALWLVYQENLSLKEVAAVLDRSLSSTKVLIHRARKRLLRHFTTDSPTSSHPTPSVSASQPS